MAIRILYRLQLSPKSHLHKTPHRVDFPRIALNWHHIPHIHFRFPPHCSRFRYRIRSHFPHSLIQLNELSLSELLVYFFPIYDLPFYLDYLIASHFSHYY